MRSGSHFKAKKGQKKTDLKRSVLSVGLLSHIDINTRGDIIGQSHHMINYLFVVGFDLALNITFV